jgi:hypothetical protein
MKEKLHFASAATIRNPLQLLLNVIKVRKQ